MILQTTYEQGQSVFITVGTDDKTKIIETKISSIDIKVIASGVKTIYNCSVDRELLGTFVPGMPQFYSVEKTEDNMFLSADDCANHITKKTWTKK